MKLSQDMHRTLDAYCQQVCTTSLGWSKKRRKDCRNMTMCHECKRRMDIAAPRESQPLAYPRVTGVGRLKRNPFAIAVYFACLPSDDEMRALHKHVRIRPVLNAGGETRRKPEGDA